MKIRYDNRRLRTIAALGASMYMLFHGRPLEIVRAFTSPGFYFAFAVSFGIALILVSFIHNITVWLDTKCGWRQMPAERAILQFTLGVLVPSLIEILLVSIYFEAKGENLIENGFLLVDFPVIILLLFLLNTYYFIHHLLLTEGGHNVMESKYQQTEPHTVNLPLEFVEDKLETTYRGREIEVNISDILFYYRLHNIVRLVNAAGNDYPVKMSLGKLTEKYNRSDFCQINRSVMINLKLVERYENGLRRDTLDLVLKPEYTELAKRIELSSFQVTREYIPPFLEKFRTRYK